MDLMPLASEFYVNFPSDVSKKSVELNNSCEVSMTLRYQEQIHFWKYVSAALKKKSQVKFNEFQNEFMKSLFLPKYESTISAIYCATLEGRNPYNFWFIFWEK